MDDLRTAVISARGLTKVYPAQRGQVPVLAVDHIDLEVKEGIHGFLGPNGAGKSSTINMLVGAITITEGSAMVGGFRAGSVAAKRLLGFLPQNPALPDLMPAMEYLLFMGMASGLSKQAALKRAAELLDFFELLDAAPRLIKTFSGGMKQKLGLAAAILHNPKILILDEPTSDLDPVGRERIIQKIKELSGQMAVFVSSHILGEVERMADTVTIIHKGHIVATDTITNLKQRHSGTTLIVQTSDNSALLDRVRTLPLVGNAWLGDGGALYVRPRQLEDLSNLQDALPRFVLEAGFKLRGFSQEQLSLQEVFIELLKIDKALENPKPEVKP